MKVMAFLLCMAITSSGFRRVRTDWLQLEFLPLERLWLAPPSLPPEYDSPEFSPPASTTIVVLPRCVVHILRGVVIVHPEEHLGGVGEERLVAPSGQH